MKWFAVLAAALAVLGLLMFQVSKPPSGAVGDASPSKLRVTLLGDSLTVLMQQQAPLDAFRKDFDLVGITRQHTTAFKGFTTVDLDKVLETVRQPPTDAVLLMVGTNDLLQDGPNAKVEGFANLMNTLKSTWPNASVFVAPVPSTHGPLIPEVTRKAWNDAVGKISKYHHATMLPDLALDPTDYEQDKVHFKKSGYEKMRAIYLKSLIALKTGEKN